MKKIWKFFIIALLAVAAPNTLASSRYVVPKGKRTLYVTGPMDGSVLRTAYLVERLSAASTDDINIVINSPGGMVFAGWQLTQAMDVARERGAKVVCSVGVLAASMAFQLLPHCDERYAMKNTLLLFHPSRVFVRGELRADEAEYVAESLRKIDKAGLIEISEMLGSPNKKWLEKHHNAETLWRAEDLIAETNSSWLTLVDDLVVPGGAFDLSGNGASDKEQVIKLELRNFRYVIVN